MTGQPHVLMCAPRHYGIEYEINPWMNRRRQADSRVALQQWEALRALLQRLGAQISLIEPVAGLPDLVFTANAGLIYGRRVILSRFRHPERRREEPVFRSWFEASGFHVEAAPGEARFEGAGDALFCGETLFAGYRMRSDAVGMQEVGRALACRVIPLELVDPFYYHLDTCFCPLRPGMAIYYPGAFDEYGRRVLEELVDERIAIQVQEARRFAANAVVLGQSVVLNTGCPLLQKALADRGFQAWETPLDEFVKAGGSAKCLTLRLDGEEAAAWKTRSAPHGADTP